METSIYPEGKSSKNLKWLNLRHPQFDHYRSYYTSGKVLVIPFIVDIRFQESGKVKKVVNQGILNVSGEISVDTENGKLGGVKIVEFDDSHGVERLGRILGFISGYGEGFAIGVVVPSLKNFFEKEAHLEDLARMAAKELQYPPL